MSIAVRGRTVAQMIEDIGSVSPDTVFYIGSKSGFFFIGTKAEYDAGIENLSAKIKQYYVNMRKKAQERIASNTEQPLEPKKGETLERYADRLACIAKQIKADLQHVDNCTKALDTWKDVQVRRVKEAYKKDELLDPSGIVLLVDGPEAGVWFKEEFENGVEKD